MIVALAFLCVYRFLDFECWIVLDVCVLLLGLGWFVLIVWIGYAMRWQSRLFILFLGFVWDVWVVCVVLIAIFAGGLWFFMVLIA